MAVVTLWGCVVTLGPYRCPRIFWFCFCFNIYLGLSLHQKQRQSVYPHLDLTAPRAVPEALSSVGKCSVFSAASLLVTERWETAGHFFLVKNPVTLSQGNPKGRALRKAQEGRGSFYFGQFPGWEDKPRPRHYTTREPLPWGSLKRMKWMNPLDSSFEGDGRLAAGWVSEPLGLPQCFVFVGPPIIDLSCQCQKVGDEKERTQWIARHSTA